MLPIVVILIISAILVTLINLYCISIILYSRKLRSPPHLAIFALLLGHTAQGLLVIPCYAAKRSGVFTYTAVCDIFRFSYLLTNYTCCLSVLLISIERFIGVEYPLRYKMWVTNSRMKKSLYGIWLYVLFLVLLPFIPSTTEPGCHFNPQKWWVTFMLMVNTFVPFFTILICYVFISRKVRMVFVNRQERTCRILDEGLSLQITNRQSINETRERKFGRAESVPKANKRRKHAHSKKTNIAFFIVGAYIVCWGPSFVYNILLTLCKDRCFHENFDGSDTKKIAGFVTKLLTFVDGLVAPLIYCCANTNFNNLRKRMYSSLRKKRFFLCGIRPEIPCPVGKYSVQKRSTSTGGSLVLRRCHDVNDVNDEVMDVLTNHSVGSKCRAETLTSNNCEKE